MNDFSSSLKKYLVFGGIWSLSGRAILIGLNFLLAMLLARLLDPPDLGRFFLIHTVIAVLVLVAPIGMTQSVVRFVSESMSKNRFEEANKAWNLALKIVVTMALLLFALFALVIGDPLSNRVFHTSLSATGLVAASIWGVALTLQNFLAEVYRGYGKIAQATLLGGLASSIIVLLFLTPIFVRDHRLELIHIITFYAIGAGIAAIFGYFSLNRQKPNQPARRGEIRHSKIRIPQLLWISVPIWIAVIATFVMLKVDFWIVGMFGTNSQAALYGVATQVSVFVGLPLAIVMSFLTPVIVEFGATGRLEELEKLLRTFASLAAIPATFCLLLLIIFGEMILGLLFGSFYQQALPILLLLGFGQLGNVISGLCGVVLMMLGQQMALLYISLLAVVFAFVGCLIAFKIAGPIGVAAASAITLTLYNMVMLLYVRFKIGIWTCVGILKASRK